MKTYLALLRGVNVGGHKKLPMAELKQILTPEFTTVKTYIQSGNIIITSDRHDAGSIGRIIAELIKINYGWEVHVMMLSAERVRDILLANPFIINKPLDKYHITVLSRLPDAESLAALRKKDFSPVKFAIEGDVIYTFTPDGQRNSKFTSAVIERELNCSSTTRNLRSFTKLAQLAEDGD